MKTIVTVLAFAICTMAQGMETSKDLEIMKTIYVTKEFVIDAPAGEIFPLLCPVREYDWIPEWKSELVFCPNGKNELDVVFKENMSAPFILNRAGGKTTWTTVVYDTINYRVHFRWDNPISSSMYKMELHPIDDTKARLTLNLAYNINEKGIKAINKNTEYKIGFMIEGLGYMLKYYCENGELIDTKNSKRKDEFVSKLSTGEKLKFLGNKLHMAIMQDRDRKSYLSEGKISSKTANKC